MGVFPGCISVHHVCSWCPWRSEEGVGSLGTEVTDACETPGMWWKLSSARAMSTLNCGAIFLAHNSCLFVKNRQVPSLPLSIISSIFYPGCMFRVLFFKYNEWSWQTIIYYYIWFHKRTFPAWILSDNSITRWKSTKDIAVFFERIWHWQALKITVKSISRAND